MDVTEQLNSIMEKSFSEIKGLPESSDQKFVDDKGRDSQLVTWCEQIGPDKYRVMVSHHIMHGLGTSSVDNAKGFTIDKDGRIEVLSPNEVLELFE